METKAIFRLPFCFRKKFYKQNRDAGLRDSILNVVMFESWLDRQLKLYFNQLVEVVATQEIPNAKKTLKNRLINKNLQK